MTEHEQHLEAKQSPQDLRRRLLKAGAASAPVIMSLSAKSALAQGTCVSPSAFASVRANALTSNAPETLSECHSHGYWKTHSWPFGASQNTLFSSVFAQPGGPAGKINKAAISFSALTLSQALNLQGGAGESITTDYTRDIVSAYLDALAGNLKIGTGTADTVAILQDMWQLAIVTGTWSTPWGGTWGRTDARAYLDVLVGSSNL
ncbi:hypothetical protein GRF61_05010 [Azoarcus sp. TTM-91]|uniref:hypothetical protein n=1 Tax=Azoarcus sp. TTM-91 TaxID=2691581 RepID=UPI00145D69F3|nr:hypothetical protein [Azoarcus sp. TTM-91]NMG33808.1 hypothetical protein [Azoarcus sp. TTM-91]